MGHTQAAAGVAGVIKMVEALRHGVLPRSLWCEEPSGLVDWSVGGVELLSQSRVWERGESVRRAGVSSFGVSGTNAHVIVEEAPAPAPVAGGGVGVGGGSLPFVVSGRSVGAVVGGVERLVGWLGGEGVGVGLGDVARGLGVGRAGLECRVGGGGGFAGGVG